MFAQSQHADAIPAHYNINALASDEAAELQYACGKYAVGSVDASAAAKLAAVEAGQAVASDVVGAVVHSFWHVADTAFAVAAYTDLQANLQGEAANIVAALEFGMKGFASAIQSNFEDAPDVDLGLEDSGDIGGWHDTLARYNHATKSRNWHAGGRSIYLVNLFRQAQFPAQWQSGRDREEDADQKGNVGFRREPFCISSGRPELSM